MKVICIRSAEYNMDLNTPVKSPIREGDSYEVLREIVEPPNCGGKDFLWYELKGYEGVGFRYDCFIPLSEIDELVLVNNKELQK